MYKDLHSFYRSKEWEALRKVILLERTGSDGVLRCEYSGQPILKPYDAVLHHKIELTEENVFDADIALNPQNIMVVSFKSHNAIHKRFDERERKVYIVYGAPCSGKSTWVRSVAYRDDLIVDIDVIWESICTSDRYHKPDRLKANAFGVRDTLIEQIKHREGQWRRAFVVGGYPLASDRERLCKILGAELVFIEERKDICLQRCKTHDWRSYVESWFDDYTRGRW